MCGIAGIVQLEPVWNRHELEACLRDSMASSLAHRGPDGEGVWVNDNATIGFVHRRLSIIELSDMGAQPMWSHDGRFCITFNGEIYNYRELKVELKSKGAQFATETDTEVILESYRHFGADMLNKFDGMFAFAIYDVTDQSLFLARDPFGEKPFYYTYNNSRFAFSSELDALRNVYDFDDTILPDELAKYLCLQYFDGESTIYRGAKKLKPGHYAILRKGSPLHTLCYFEFNPCPEPGSRSMDDWADELEGILIGNLSRRLRADVPVGAFLSAGVDSSTVVALAAHKLNVQLETFSVGFEGFDGSEHEQAAEIAAHIGVPHHTRIVTRDDLSLFKNIGEHVDEPNGDSSLLPTYLLSEFARKKVKVALSGDGADELFGGYGRYMATLAEEDLLEVGGAAAGDRYYSNRILVNTERDLANLIIVPRPGLHACLHSLRSEINNVSRENLLAALRRTDAEHYLPGAVLAKVDRMSMRHGLEVRTPFLSIQMARFAERLPDDMLIKGDAGKLVLKQLAARYLPRSWLDRPKRGFGWPSYQWAGMSLYDQANDKLIENRDRTTWWINRPGMRRWLYGSLENNDNNSYKLWALLHLQSYIACKGGMPGNDIDMMSGMHLKKALKNLPSPVLAFSHRYFPSWREIYPDIDRIACLFDGPDKKTETYDWLQAPDDVIRSINTELDNSVKTVVLLDKGEFDNSMSSALAKVGVQRLVSRPNRFWEIKNLAKPQQEYNNHYIPLLFNLVDETHCRFEKQGVLYDLYKHLPWFSVRDASRENVSDWLLMENIQLFRLDTPLRAFRLFRELVAWGMSGWTEYLALRQLSRLSENQENTEWDSQIKEKRIGLFISDLGSGGAERQLCNLAVGLKQRGFEVCVFTLSPHYGSAVHYMPLLEKYGIEVVSCASPYEGFAEEYGGSSVVTQAVKLLGGMPMFIHIPAWAFYTHLVRWRPGVVISFLDQPNLIAGVSGLLARIPKIIMSFRNHNPSNFDLYQGWFDRYYRTLVSSKQVLLTGNSVAGNNSYARWLGVSEDRVALMRNGVDFSSIPHPTNDEMICTKENYNLNGSKIIVGVFRLSEEKRPELFVRVIGKVLKEINNVKALVVGDGPERRRLEQYILDMGLENNILLVGRKSNVEDFIGIADVVLHTARLEGTPNALLEAQYLQKPVVTTPAGGAAETVDNGVTGFVLDAEDELSLSNAVVRLLCDPGLAESMGKNGRNFVEEKFSIEKMVDGFSRLIDDIAVTQYSSTSMLAE